MNNDIKFSLFFNSRHRVQLVYDLLNNIIETTNNLNEIEVLISFDSDDKQSLMLISELIRINHPILPILNYEFKYRDQKLISGYNRMVSFAKGKYVFVLNDDARILTQDWDTLCYPILESVKDGIIYGHTIDDSCDKVNGGPYASFPIISKKATNILGFFMQDCFVGLGGDVGVYRIFEEIDRIIDLPLRLSHLLHTTVEKVVNTDQTAYEMRDQTRLHYVDPWTLDISQDVAKLRQHMSI